MAQSPQTTPPPVEPTKHSEPAKVERPPVRETLAERKARIRRVGEEVSRDHRELLNELAKQVRFADVVFLEPPEERARKNPIVTADQYDDGQGGLRPLNQAIRELIIARDHPRNT